MSPFDTLNTCEDIEKYSFISTYPQKTASNKPNHIYFGIPAFLVYFQQHHSAKCTTEPTVPPTDPPNNMKLAAQHAVWSHTLAGSNGNLLESCRFLDKQIDKFMKKYKLYPVPMTDFRSLVADLVISNSVSSERDEPEHGNLVEPELEDDPEAGDLSQEEDAARTASQGSSTTLNSLNDLFNEASPPYSKKRKVAVKVPASVPEDSRSQVSESSSESNLSMTSIRFPGADFGSPEYIDYVFLNFASNTESNILKTYDVGDKEPWSYSKFVRLTKPGALPLGFKFPEVLVPEEEGGFDFIASVKKIFESVNEDVLLNVKPANKVRRLPSSSRLS